MTLTQMTFFFLGILGVILVAMIVHSYLDKRKIKKWMERIAQQLPGDVEQENLFEYPRLYSQRPGQRFDLFFNLVKVGRHHLLYSVYTHTLARPLPHSFFLIKKEVYRPIQDETQFTAEYGAVFTGVDPYFEGRSLSPAWAEKRYEALKEPLCALHSFTSLQLGPDAIVMGKPYEEEDPAITLRYIEVMEAVAEQLEKEAFHHSRRL